jgi:hypothetical protein
VAGLWCVTSCGALGAGLVYGSTGTINLDQLNSFDFIFGEVCGSLKAASCSQ